MQRRRLVFRVYAFAAGLAIAITAAFVILPRYTRGARYLEPQAYESLRLDLVMFDKGGVVAKRLAVQAAPLPVGKTSLKVFDITDHACEDIGSILLNDVLECTSDAASAGGCLARIAVSARGEVKFLK